MKKRSTKVTRRPRQKKQWSPQRSRTTRHSVQSGKASPLSRRSINTVINPNDDFMNRMHKRDGTVGKIIKHGGKVGSLKDDLVFKRTSTSRPSTALRSAEIRRKKAELLAEKARAYLEEAEEAEAEAEEAQEEAQEAEEEEEAQMQAALRRSMRKDVREDAEEKEMRAALLASLAPATVIAQPYVAKCDGATGKDMGWLATELQTINRLYKENIVTELEAKKLRDVALAKVGVPAASSPAADTTPTTPGTAGCAADTTSAQKQRALRQAGAAATKDDKNELLQQLQLEKQLNQEHAARLSPAPDRPSYHFAPHTHAGRDR